MESRRQASADLLSLIVFGVVLSMAFIASLDRNPLPYVISVIGVGLIPVVLLAYAWVTNQINLTWMQAILAILAEWVTIAVTTFIMSLGVPPFILVGVLVVTLFLVVLINLPTRPRRD